MATVINDQSPTGATVCEGEDFSMKFAPRFDWREMSASEHFVQFYEADTFLLDSLSGFISAGLDNGDACIVIAAASHCEELNKRLVALGLDVEDALRSGQFIALDAAETLSRFMVDGQPDSERFAEVIGGLVASTLQGWPRVRAFGEMVAVLWAEGNHAAAIRLEELWNNLQGSHSFSLFCAYPMNDLGGESFVQPFGDVCAGHSRVIPAESYSELTSADDRLRAITKLQQKARTLEAEIAERKKAEGSLRTLKEELEIQLVREQMARSEAESANRLKDEFLATVSHELRTPLNAVIGWSYMLRSGALDEATAARAIETIERNAKSQAQLVEDILDVSRVITGKLRLNIGAVDIASVINSAIDSVQLAADSKKIQLKFTLDPSARRVSGDAGRLQQAVWNLLSNAIKFTPAGGQVEVRLEREDFTSRIIISDSGDGISPDFLPFIFDRFRQADGTSTRLHGGLGLGLAIVRHLIELHGGTVLAQSAGKGQGATFTISLPLSPNPERARALSLESVGSRSYLETSAPLEPMLPSLEGLDVLLVDDDEATLNMLSVMLTECRAHVQTARSAVEALEVLKWHKPDVMVSDLAMPAEDGFSLIARIRELEAGTGKRTPAVALTAFVRIEDRARALAAGFNMFVPKPVEPRELITAIANLADTRSTNPLSSH